MNLVSFHEIFYNASPRYYDVTHFLTDPDENSTAYIKLKIKGILFVRFFWFSEYL